MNKKAVFGLDIMVKKSAREDKKECSTIPYHSD